MAITKKRPIVLIGHGYGGHIALEVARLALEERRAGVTPRLAGVVLMSPDTDHQAKLSQTMIQQDLDGVKSLLPCNLAPELADEVRSMAHSMGAEHFGNQLEGNASRADTAEVLEALGAVNSANSVFQ